MEQQEVRKASEQKMMITRVVSFICLSIQQTVWSQLTRIFLGRVETTNQIHPWATPIDEKLQATTFIDALMRVLSQSKRVYYSDINMYRHPFWAMPLQTKLWFEYTVAKSHDCSLYSHDFCLLCLHFLAHPVWPSVADFIFLFLFWMPRE